MVSPVCLPACPPSPWLSQGLLAATGRTPGHILEICPMPVPCSSPITRPPCSSSVLKSVTHAERLLILNFAGHEGLIPFYRLRKHPATCSVGNSAQLPSLLQLMAIPTASIPVLLFVSSNPQILVLLFLRGRAQFLLHSPMENLPSHSSLPLSQHQASAAHPPLLLNPLHPRFYLCLRKPLSSSLV